MIKSRIAIAGLLAVMLLCGCVGSNRKAFSDGVVDMNSLMDCSVKASFEALGYEPEMVALQTSDSCLLPANSHVIYATESDVFIAGKNRLYRFSLDGSFENTVGTMGQGPMEYTLIHCVSFNEKDSLVYLYDGSRRMLVYTMDDKALKQVSLETDGYVTMAYALPDGYWAEERNSENGKVTYSVVWFDADGRKTGKEELASFVETEAATYITAPVVKQLSDGRYFYYDAFSSAGYAISENSVEKAVTIDYGKFGADKEKLNDMSYREMYRDEFCEILDFYDDGGVMLLLMVKGTEFRAAMIDEKSGDCLFCHTIGNPRRGGGIEICSDGKLSLWPSCFRNGILYGLIDMTDIDGDILTRNSLPAAQNAEANPCLAVIRKNL